MIVPDSSKTRLANQSISNMAQANFKTMKANEEGMTILFTKKSSQDSINDQATKIKQMAIFNNTLHFKTLENNLIHGFQF